MSMKRSYSDVESRDHDADSPPASSSATNGFDPKRRKQHGSGKHKAKEGSLEFSKKRSRNIERLLQRKKGLPANVQNDLQRELAALKSTVSDKSFQKKRSAMISKYHMVRFFERKKAARLVKQLKRRIDNDPNADNIDDLKRKLHIAEVDEAYTIHHPHIEPYISLYGNSKKQDNDEGEDDDDEASKQESAAMASLESERPHMWTLVEKTMEEGPEALNGLRERRSTEDTRPSGARPPRRTGPKANARPDITNNAARETRHESDIAKQKEKQTDKQPPANRTDATSKANEAPQLNRRERRRLMREAMAQAEGSDDDGDGGFFEEG